MQLSKSKQFCSFADQGGKQEVWRGGDFINVKEAEIYMNVKKAEIFMNVRKTETYINVKNAEIYINVKKGKIYIYIKLKVVSQPITNYIKLESIDAVKHVVAVDMMWPLNLAKEIVMKDSSDYKDVEMSAM